MTYDLVVIGNGIIGALCALNIKLNSPKLKIALIGKANRPFSASTGAGAMANVYAEIEKGPLKDQNEARYLQIGLSAREKWLKILNKNQPALRILQHRAINKLKSILEKNE